MKEFFKLFNSGTSEGVKKSWENRNRLSKIAYESGTEANMAEHKFGLVSREDDESPDYISKVHDVIGLHNKAAELHEVAEKAYRETGDKTDSRFADNHKLQKQHHTEYAKSLALAGSDRMKNSKITDILCPDESGHWAAVLDNSKIFFKLDDGKVLLNWEHKEKKDYQDWDEEPKVDGAWDEDLIGGGGDEILNSGNSEGVYAKLNNLLTIF